MEDDYNSAIHRRRSIRLRDYDYASSGIYFVTVCTKNKECRFGDVADGEMGLNEAGKIIQTTWDALPRRYANIDLDVFVVMPTHVHGVIVLTDRPLVGAGLALPGSKGAASSAPTLGDVIRTFKSVSAIRVNRLLMRTGQPMWHRNYYEHIIRSQDEFDKIREYIVNNPVRWVFDHENPATLDTPNDFDKELFMGGGSIDTRAR